LYVEEGLLFVNFLSVFNEIDVSSSYVPHLPNGHCWKRGGERRREERDKEEVGKQRNLKSTFTLPSVEPETRKFSLKGSRERETQAAV
jgi:hypothetical protein